MCLPLTNKVYYYILVMCVSLLRVFNPLLCCLGTVCLDEKVEVVNCINAVGV